MSIKVAEAIGAETGAKDGASGDQTGNEILVRTFKRRSYDFTEFLRCTNRVIAETAVSYITRIAACSKFGYSQRNRWDGAKAIEEVGASRLEEAHAGDFDCSSLVIESYRLAGAPLKQTGYTGNIRQLLLDTGLFMDVDLRDVEEAQKGDVFVAPSIHTLMVISDGSKAAPEPEPQPTPTPANSYVYVRGDNVRVRTGPSKDYDTILIAHKGQTYPFIRADEETGWYWIETKLGTACITNKSKYTTVIMGVQT